MSDYVKMLNALEALRFPEVRSGIDRVIDF